MVKIDYKEVTKYEPHCPKCHECLRGNNSFIFRYKCSCGTWMPVYGSLLEFEVVNEKDSAELLLKLPRIMRSDWQRAITRKLTCEEQRMSETNDAVTSQVERLVSYEVLQKRLMNTEMALVGLWTLLQDVMPPDTQGFVGQMMNEYYDANTEMGADFDLSKGWNIDS